MDPAPLTLNPTRHADDGFGEVITDGTDNDDVYRTVYIGVAADDEGRFGYTVDVWSHYDPNGRTMVGDDYDTVDAAYTAAVARLTADRATIADRIDWTTR